MNPDAEKNIFITTNDKKESDIEFPFEGDLLDRKKLDIRLNELSEEINLLKESHLMTPEEVSERVLNFWRAFATEEEVNKFRVKGYDGEKLLVDTASIISESEAIKFGQSINEKIEKVIQEIVTQASNGIDYVNYIENISDFLQGQITLQKAKKPSLAFELLHQKEGESLHPHYLPFYRKVILVDYGFAGPSINPVARLFDIATTGTDTYSAILQHEVIHHYQRIREKSPVLRFLKIAKLRTNKSWKSLEEIHARLHDSMFGTVEDSEEKIIGKLLESYGLSEKQREQARKAIRYIKELYALDISDRRIAYLIRQSNSLNDLTLLEKEVEKEMSEKNIVDGELRTLVEIDELQRILLNLRLERAAQIEIINQTGNGFSSS